MLSLSDLCLYTWEKLAVVHVCCAQEEINQMQSHKQGVHALISMWNTDQPPKPQMTTAFFFNLQQGGQSYNYYLEPCESSNPTADVTLTKVCVTGLTSDQLAQENSRHLFFSIDIVPTHCTDNGAVDVGMGKADSHPDGTVLSSLKTSKLLSQERPDSGLGSLGASSEES